MLKWEDMLVSRVMRVKGCEVGRVDEVFCDAKQWGEVVVEEDVVKMGWVD